MVDRNMTTVKTGCGLFVILGEGVGSSLKQVLILIKREIVLEVRFFQCKVYCFSFSEVNSGQRPRAVMPSTALNNRRLIC